MTDIANFTEVTSESELREILGDAMPRALAKERSALHDIDRQWLSLSPFCLVATSDENGNCDVSPKGDPAGQLVHVLDDTTITIPERLGNRRADGFFNVLRNPHVGLLFMIPGRGDTLRVNGRARIVKDAPFFDDMVVKGHRPQLALVVEIETVFFHCAKAFLRSDLWKPETWEPAAMPSHAKIVIAVQPTGETLEQLEEYYGPAYLKKLYETPA